MMRWKIDEAPWDPFLGHVVVGEGHQAIRATDTYVDAWFFALMEGTERVLSGDDSPFSVPIIDEKPLRFTPMRGDSFFIDFEGQTVLLGPKVKVARDVARDVRRFFVGSRAAGTPIGQELMHALRHLQNAIDRVAGEDRSQQVTLFRINTPGFRPV